MSGEILEERRAKIQSLTQRQEDIRRVLVEKYCDVGKAILEKAEKEGREVNELVDELIEVKKELIKAKGQKRCTNCYQYNEMGSIYCSKCGAKLEKSDSDETGENAENFQQ